MLRQNIKGGDCVNKFTAEEVLLQLADVLMEYLEELREMKDTSDNGFVYGEQTAYTECLEILQLWEDAAYNGLDFEVEKRFPL